MSVDEVMTGQVHRAVMGGVDEVGLHHGVVGMVHGIGCVDYIHLEEEKTHHTFRKSAVMVNERGHRLQSCYEYEVNDKRSLIPPL